MDATALNEIQRFLSFTGHADLFAYFELDTEAPAADIQRALRRRRSWAQGQQANPKYRSEALWLIKNIKLLQAAMTTDKAAYLQALVAQTQQRAIESLRFFIQTTLVDGELQPKDEPAIMEQAAELGIPEADVQTHIELVLTAVDQGLMASPPEADEAAQAQNHYSTLGVPPHADHDALEAAYRERYRWARNLRDTEESSRIYAELDEAWRVLKDPEQRALYNAEQGFSSEPEATAPEDPHDAPAQVGYLPPPLPPAPPEADPSEGTSVDSPPDEPASSDDELETPGISLEDPVQELDDPEEETPVEATPVEATPVEETPEEATPVEATPVEETPVEETPVEEAPVEATPVEETPVEEVIGQELEDPHLEMDGEGAPPQASASERTLDIGSVNEEDIPILTVDGPRTIRIRTGDQPFPVRITIQNTGGGQMAGSIVCSEDWAEISPRHLNPNRKEHSIEVLVDPAKMPKNSGRAKIEISTSHGESVEITIDALQHLVSPKMVVASVLAVLLIIGASISLYFFGDFSTTPPPPPRTILAVRVDPPAGEVYIDDTLMGNQGSLSLADSFTIDEPIHIRVELDGFEPWSKKVTVSEGQQIRVEASLSLRDPMNFEVEDGMRQAEIDSDALHELLERRVESFNNCFTRHLQPASPYTASITVGCVVSPRGFVSGLSFQASNFENLEVQACLRRQLRALKLPVLAGDYATFDHTFRARVGSPDALSSENEPSP